jgi:hypothetical protein
MTRQRPVRRLFSPKRVIAGLILIFLVTLGLLRPLNAQSVSQGYGADETLQKGMVVMLKTNDVSKVTVAGYNDSDKVHGVVVNANDSPVTITSEGNSVFVATSGRYEVLVSDENGAIKTGDYLTLSHANGIAMKVDTNQSIVIGKAVQDFTKNRPVLATTKVNGKTVHIGRIQTDVGIGPNPMRVNEKNNIPKILQSASQTVARRTVNPIRLYISVIVLLFTVIIAGSMLYAGVKTSITAIGRNPLSKRDIRKSLLQVTISSIMVFIIGLFTVYLLLKL